MKVSTSNRRALCASIAAALLAACGGSQPPIGVPGGAPKTPALTLRTGSTNYKVVYSFGGTSDGAIPNAGLIDVAGMLYGTTTSGGAYSCGYLGNCGTVFSVTMGGTERVLHSFGAVGDGENPGAGLINVGGTLYGTTAAGGTGYGTVLAC